MNPDMYTHTVNVKRVTDSTPGVGAYTPGMPIVLTSIPCLVEPMSARQMDSIVGRIPTAQFVITWGADDIRNGDTIVFQSGEYVLRDLKMDTLRPDLPYQTAILARVAGR